LLSKKLRNKLRVMAADMKNTKLYIKPIILPGIFPQQSSKSKGKGRELFFNINMYIKTSKIAGIVAARAASQELLPASLASRPGNITNAVVAVTLSNIQKI
jgi:hypothetical protein